MPDRDIRQAPTRSTRNDGVPPPSVGAYRSLVAGSWIAAGVAAMCLTPALIGFHRTPDERAGWSWGSWVTAAVVSTAVWYALAWSAVRAGGRALRPRKPVEVQSELAWEPVRDAYFGRRRMPLPVSLVPVVFSLPLVFADQAARPDDPAGGEPPVSPVALAVGVFLPFTIILLQQLTGRLLTALALAAWLAWAGFEQAGAQTAAAWGGGIGSAAVLLALAGNVVVVRRRIGRGQGARSMIRRS